MKSIAWMATAALFAVAGAVVAQEKFPSKPIVMIMPTPPGGGTDTLGRKLAEAAEQFLGQKVVVENKPGASGAIGIMQVVQSAADGYTIGAMWNGAVTTSPHTTDLPYTLESFEPFLQIGSGSYVVCAHADFPANTAKELIDLLKANPDKYTLGNDGIGNTMQLAAERIFGHFGARARPVPFGGAGETARNFLGRHIDLYGGSIPPVLQHVNTGRVKCLLLTSAEDNAVLPNASGLKKLGVPQLETVLWWGLIAPKGVPADRMSVLEEAFRKAADSPAYRDALAKLGAQPIIRERKEFVAHIKSEYDALGEVVRRLGLKKKAN